MFSRYSIRGSERSRGAKPVIRYRFRVRDSSRGAWRMAAEKMTLDHVRLVFGDGNYRKVDGSEERLSTLPASAPTARGQAIVLNKG